MTSSGPTSVPGFYDQQWATEKTIEDYNLFLIIFKNALRHSYAQLGELPGKKLLEIGCGSGQQAVFLAAQGAEVTAIDVSEKSIVNTQALAKEQKVNVKTKQMNAEQLRFSPETFDLIYLNSVLMHVNPSTVLGEGARVLKPGGKIVIVEPLRSNLLLRFYRRLFSPYAKMNPHYLTLPQFQQLQAQLGFSRMEHQEFYCMALAALPLYHLFSDKQKASRLSWPLEKVDAALLKLIPPLGQWCWVTVVGYQK